MEETVKKKKKFCIAIDPGTEFSGVCIIRSADQKPLYIGKLLNAKVVPAIEKWFAEKEPYLLWLDDEVDCVIERMQGNNFSVGATTFLTCEWIGEFRSLIRDRLGILVQYIYRREEYKILCGNIYTKNDTGIRNALVDMYAQGEKNYGKGTKQAPGWFYGFKADVWQSYAQAVSFLIREYGI